MAESSHHRGTNHSAVHLIDGFDQHLESPVQQLPCTLHGVICAWHRSESKSLMLQLGFTTQSKSSCNSLATLSV